MSGTRTERDARGLGARVRAALPLKIGVWIGLAVGICVPYFGIQHIDWMAPRTLPATAIDGAVPFSPGWIYWYASLALLVPLAPLLASTRAELVRYAQGLALLCVPCFVIFLLVPVVGPRPELHPENGFYAWIVSVDRPSNSLPSLHAGLTAYSLLFIDRVLTRGLEPQTRALLRVAGIAWAALILYSTLATRQHWLLDLPPGVLIAWAAHTVVWRGVAAQREGPG